MAVSRADARFALGQSLASLALWPGVDDCATAPGDIVPGSAQSRWTYCVKADGSAAYLVSTLPTDSHVAADVYLAPEEDSAPAVYAPKETLSGDSGSTYAAVAWWAEDLGAKAPIASTDGRDDTRLFSDLPAADAVTARTLLTQQMPGPYDGKDASYTARRSAFVLSNPYDGGLREDLSALADTDASLYAHPPSDGEAAWMRASVAIGDSAVPQNTAARIEPVVTEFLLACGLGADSDQYKDRNKSQLVDILLTYHIYVELWNPATRALKTGATSPDIRVVVKGLPGVTGTTWSGEPEITLPDPLTTDLDCWNNLSAGSVQLLSSPVYEGGTNAQGAWQVVVGSIVANKYNYGNPVVLQFSAASPVVEFYDLASSETVPFYTLKLDHYTAFNRVYGAGNQFFRSATLTTSYGMGRAAINAGGWGFAYHMRLKDEDLATLLGKYDLRDSVAEVDAFTGGDAYHEVLAAPASYTSEMALMESDFFASKYRDEFVSRRALFIDPPAMEPVSFASLRHAPTEGRAALAVGAGIVEEADAELDRYFFSTLPSGDWDGTGVLRNFRLIPAEKGTPVTRSPSDASGLLLKGGFNINSTSAKAWRAVLGTLELANWKVPNSSGAESTIDLAVPLFSLPWSAAFPPTDAAATYVVAGDTEPFANESNSLYKARSHPSFLVGVRDIGASADALAGEIATRIKAHARPFRTLAEFAQSGILQDAIDAVPSINLREDGTDTIPAGSPAHVDQGELLAALSPILFTRSDTFLVRVYGCDEKTGAEAWGEALVQRLPTAVDGDAAKYGRRLKVMSLRWLGANDL